MKKLLLCFLVFTSSFFLPGCWDRIEVNDIALIMGVAIDKKDDNLIEVTVEIISPGLEGGQSNGAGGGVGKTVTRSAVGVNMAEALEKLQERLPRKVFWGHSEIIVISEKLAEEGLLNHIQFFFRHREPRIRAYLFIAKDQAKEVMALLPPIEPTSAEVLREMSVHETLLGVTLLEFMQMAEGESRASALPMIQILPPSKERSGMETIAYISGSAIVKEGKMIGTIDDVVTRGLKWIRNETHHGNLSVKPIEEEGYVTGTIVHADTELIPRKDNNQWTITVKSNIAVEITINETTLDLGLPKNIETLQNSFENQIEQRMKITLDQVQKKMKADVFEFSRAIEVAYPKDWEAMKEDWDIIFPTIEVTFDTNADVTRRGQVQKYE
ncbi:Ger(x)C family spore germination protein [Anaerobacillus sp. MEB173]|uniref:Ger(x)C family spore germination protein n=1 Tax=Anaerobacillus sp. MEB173 TaxID=3383345 RepID=UPI003F8E9471